MAAGQASAGPVPNEDSSEGPAGHTCEQTGAAMKVAVTGASGLIGSALTASLRDSGDQVVTLVRRTPASRR